MDVCVTLAPSSRLNWTRDVKSRDDSDDTTSQFSHIATIPSASISTWQCGHLYLLSKEDITIAVTFPFDTTSVIGSIDLIISGRVVTLVRSDDFSTFAFATKFVQRRVRHAVTTIKQ